MSLPRNLTNGLSQKIWWAKFDLFSEALAKEDEWVKPEDMVGKLN